MSAGAPPDEGFLSRWSRRKREPGEGDQAPLGPPPAQLPAEAQATEPEPPEPELVEPPSLDLIDKDFNVAHWLKQNVPEAWKLAAMRRAWESDPAIAGFENPARDYALDWNTPGGAPGYGPLTESDDVAEMVRGIFGDTPKPETPVDVAEAQISDGMSHPLSSHDDAAVGDAAMRDEAEPAQELASVRLSDGAETGTNPVSAAAFDTQPIYAAAQNNVEGTDISPRIRKRGGGATPV